MDFRTAARKHRGKPRRGDDGNYYLFGSRGDIYEWAEGLYVMYYHGTPQQWTWTKKLGIKRGFTVYQDGDSEGTLLFEGKPPEWDWAMSRVGHRRKRRLSDEQLARLGAQLENIRNKGERAAEEWSVCRDLCPDGHTFTAPRGTTECPRCGKGLEPTWSSSLSCERRSGEDRRNHAGGDYEIGGVQLRRQADRRKE